MALEKITNCVREVVQGKADAFIFDQFTVFSEWKKNPKTTRALLQPFIFEYWAMGVRKGDDKLLKQINAFLDQYRKDGGFEKLGDKYFKEQKVYFEANDIPFYF